MTYTQIAIAVVIAAIVADVFILRTRLVTRRGFWVAYAIVVFFQLLTNGVLTRLQVFRYSDSMIVGYQPDSGPPPFMGSGRIAYQPFEDLLMGFSLCLLSMALWIYWGRRGVQRTPMSGPPIWRRSGSRAPASPGTTGADPGGSGYGQSSP
jgi:lycopene cyclase domain-containing protein